MKILSISNLKKTYTNYVNKTGEKKAFSPSFLSHPTYDYFEKTSNIRASSHFRRGRYYGTPSENYKDVEYTLKKVLENKKKPSFLLVGIGHGEEAYSLAASIYTILGKPKKLSKVVDFNGVDLGPKLTEKDIKNSSIFYNMNMLEEFNIAMDSFNNRKSDGSIWYEGAEFKPEITNFIKKSLNSKSFVWDTSIQDFLKKNKKTYDVFVMNNVLLYMPEAEQVETLLKAKEIVNQKGFIITDPDDNFFKKHKIFDDWIMTYPGIYQKP